MTEGALVSRPDATAERLLRGAVARGLGSGAQAAVLVGAQGWEVHAGRTLRERRVCGDGLAWHVLPSPGRPVDASTAFDLASLTKPIATATRWAQVLTRGKSEVDLDMPLHAVLAEARGTALGIASLRQLLGHAAGTPAWCDFWTPTLGLPPPQRAVRVRHAVLATGLEAPAGARAVYSDLGYLALGFALEALDGRPLDEQFHGEIAEPLGGGLHFRRAGRPPPEPMRSVAATEIDSARCPTGRPLQGEVHDSNAAALDGVAGHAGLFGSAADVLAWAQAWRDLLHATPGRGPNPLGIDPAVARQLVTSAAAPGTTWRLGWDTPTQPGSTAGSRAPGDALGHLGFTGTSVWIAPSANACVVLLTNRVHPSRLAAEGIRALRPHFHDSVWESALMQPR